MNDLPWAERVAMLSIHPDAASREDVARLAAELMEAKQMLTAWCARDAGSEDMLWHQQKRTQAAEARAARLASCLSNLGQDAHMGDCRAALHDFVSGFECDCGVSIALSVSDTQITETEHPLKTAARLSRPKSK